MNENIEIFEVGGSIRNEILGLPLKDRDFAVLAPSYNHMREYLMSRGAKIYQERPEFVSIKAKLPELGAVDFTLARKESFYTDARHPDSVSPAKTIEEDLARRDFTMNAIARNVHTREMFDPFNGIQDITAKVVRAVGNAKQRFDEDRLRIFRALRFATVLNFYISPEVREAINTFTPDDFDSVSANMIQIETWKMFAADTLEAFHLMHDFPYLMQVLVNKGLKLKPTLEQI